MDREHVKGAADKAKGAIKEGAGKLTGDKELETEGKLDKAKGSAHNVAGDVKDAARDAADAIKNRRRKTKLAAFGRLFFGHILQRKKPGSVNFTLVVGSPRLTGW